ncbi:MAG: SwmB domain-containing protein, partial [Rhodospirillales bacterium]
MRLGRELDKCIKSLLLKQAPLATVNDMTDLANQTDAAKGRAMTDTKIGSTAIVRMRNGEDALALLLGGDAAPIAVRHGTQAGTLLPGVFVEAEDGALAARLAHGGHGVRRIEIPTDAAARQAFFASWASQGDLARRGLGIGLLLLPLAACGGGGGGGTGTVATTTTGFVIDGYIAGATVFRDGNGNRQLDGGEVSTTSGTVAPDIGRFTLGGNLSQQIVAIGGTDVSTGDAFRGVLIAPAGATVVTPLTTLVSILMSSTGGGLSQSAALAEVRAALGLNAGDENLILSTDPIATNNIRLAKAGAQLGNIFNAVGAAAGGDAATQQAAAFNIARELAVTIRDAPGTVSLADLSVLNTAVTNANVTLSAADRQAVAAKNQRLNGADIDTIAEINTVQQTPTPSEIAVDRTARTVTLTFTEQLDAANPPPTSAFEVTTQIGGVATTNAVQSVVVSGKTVTLTLTTPFDAGQVDVRYTDPTAGNDVAAIQDTAGNDALTFTSG